jgi:murein DD-endopeptidase MepM/ murein hydrolase activator NlpD
MKNYSRNISKEKKEYENLEIKEKIYNDKIANLSNKISKLNSEKKNILEKMSDSEKEILKLNEQLKQLSTLIAHLKSKNASKSYKFSSQKIPWPVKGGIIKYFGLIKKNKIKFQNNGIDIAAKKNTAIKAVDNGKIVFCEWFNGMGNMIIIDHLNGFKTIYAHCGSILVSKGDDVIKGQIIGKVGMSGSVNQPEIHFEIRKSGKPINPMQYLEER